MRNYFFGNDNMDKEIDWRGLLLLVLLLCSPMFLCDNAKADTLFGKVVAVTDGDTLAVLDSNNEQHVIRLFAIDAPETSCHAQKPSEYDDACVETSQPYGKASKRSLSALVFGKSVNVEIQPGKTYGREIGTVWVGNINANLEQVKRGYAMMYRQYAKHGLLPEEYQEMEEAEHEAHEHGLGLWEDSHPTPPWEYRHSR